MELNPTITLMKKVYRITNEIVNRVKKLRKQGGRQMKLYLLRDWQIQLSPSDVKNPRQIALESKLAAQIQKAKSRGFKSTRGRSSAVVLWLGWRMKDTQH